MSAQGETRKPAPARPGSPEHDHGQDASAVCRFGHGGGRGHGEQARNADRGHFARALGHGAAPLGASVEGLSFVLPWDGVASAQGWLDHIGDAPARVLVDIWPALARNGVEEFRVTKADTPMTVLVRAERFLTKRYPLEHFWLETDRRGRARLHASRMVYDGGPSLAWLMLDGVECLRWTNPRLFPVALRACAVLWFVCNIGHEYLYQFEEQVEWGEEWGEEYAGNEEIARTLHHEQARMVEEMRVLGRPGDPAVLLAEAERLGPGYFDVQDMARQVVEAAEILGSIWEIPSDEADGASWRDMFQVFFSHMAFLDWAEMVFNDHAGNVGMDAAVVSCRLSRFGRSGSLEAMHAEADRMERGFEALHQAIDSINEITGWFDGWNEWREEVQECGL